MYPDTDMPPIAVTADRIARLNKQLPERVWDRVAFARENGVPVGLANLTAVSPRWAVFREAVEAGVKATRAASLLVETARHLERTGHDVSAAPWMETMKRDLKKKDERGAILEALA